MRSSYLFAWAVSFLAGVQAYAQPYVFARIVNDNTPRPDGKGLFNISGAFTVPSFDGQWVVFREYGPVNDQSAQAVWSFNILDGTFHKLADLSTPVAGGAGTFKDLQLQDTAPIVRNGIVIFVGRDSNPNRTNVAGGLYSIPAAGGSITKLADYNTLDPSGGTFAAIDSYSSQVGAFQFDGNTVVFKGVSTNGANGTYTVKPDGSSLAMVADSLHPFTPTVPVPLLQLVMGFSPAAVSGGNVIIDGTSGLDPTEQADWTRRRAITGCISELQAETESCPNN